MPYAENGDARLYYEVKGHGFPLLMIAGLGSSLISWPPKLISKLSKHYKLILFDNRGIGKSTYSGDVYSAEVFASDAYCVLKACGISNANVLGISLGGFIAQELCLNYPDVVKKAVLVSTHHGGENRIKPELDDVRKMFYSPFLSEKENISRRIEVMFSKKYAKSHFSKLERYYETRLEASSSYSGVVLKQSVVGRNYDAKARLSSLEKQVLILQGEEDKIVRPGNAELLGKKISNSEVIVYKNTGHMLLYERPYCAARDIINFLK